jgi:hypothetical protein
MPAPKKPETAEVPADIVDTIVSAVKVEDGVEVASATNRPGVVRTTSTDTYGNQIEEH